MGDWIGTHRTNEEVRDHLLHGILISINYTQKGNGKTVKPDYSDFGRKVLVARLRAIAADQAALA